MDAFLVFAPAVLDREDTRVEVGEDHPVNIVGLYPIHRSERDFVNGTTWTLSRTRTGTRTTSPVSQRSDFRAVHESQLAITLPKVRTCRNDGWWC